MKKLSTWILLMFAVMFWLFRVIIAVGAELGWKLGALAPLNQTFEITLLFLTLVCFIFIVKRKVIGGLMYLLLYGLYFGADVMNNISGLIGAIESGMDITLYLNLVISVIGIVLPLAIVLDLVTDKSRKDVPKDKKTDWFYDNEKFDRKLDEGADQNNYRTL